MLALIRQVFRVFRFQKTKRTSDDRFGSLPRVRLNAQETEIATLLDRGVSRPIIARLVGMDWIVLSHLIRSRELASGLHGQGESV